MLQVSLLMLGITRSFCDQAEVATTMFKKWPQMATFMVWPFLAKLNHRPIFLFAISKEDIERYNILKNEKNLWVGRFLNLASMMENDIREIAVLRALLAPTGCVGDHFR